MVLTSESQFAYVKEVGNPFFELFPHRFDYIYAPHPEPFHSPNWQTESRHPLTDRMLDQGRFLYGVRFGGKTQYCLLDIDAGSPYHPTADSFAIQRILAAFETIGLVRYLVITSSDSGGLHLYFPFQNPQNSWDVGAAITALLENAGFTVKPGCLEVFPNRKTYSVQGKPSLFNAHRLPLQMGSYLLNRDFQPIWGDRSTFIQQWQVCQTQNSLLGQTLRRIIKQNQQQHHQISGKAAKFLNDLNAEIEAGWSGPGQTNYLLGRITMRAYIFHHVVEGQIPLVGQALIEKIVSTARSLPGYSEWCNHQHEIEDRAAEWARCIESSRYFQYGTSSSTRLVQPVTSSNNQPGTLTWNQQQSQKARDRIQQAIADLLNKNALPSQPTARFKALAEYGIGGGSLYRHKDLWHPEFLNSECLDQSINSTLKTLDFTATENQELLDQKFSATFKNLDLDLLELEINDSIDLSTRDKLDQSSKPLQYSTSLLPLLGGNSLPCNDLDRSIFDFSLQIGRNALWIAGFTDNQVSLVDRLAFDQLVIDRSDFEFRWDLIDRSTGLAFSISLNFLADHFGMGDRFFKPP